MHIFTAIDIFYGVNFSYCVQFYFYDGPVVF